MATADAERATPEDEHVASEETDAKDVSLPEETDAKGVSLPEVAVRETADEEQFDCPQPWYLALLTMAMSAMTSITVAGALFFLLAAPEKVSPHCYERKDVLTRGFCTASTLCFWTYPVVCCLFVVIVYAKNMVDQRTYYEFLLHKVVIGYTRSQAWKSPVVLGLLFYALLALSALIWYSLSKPTVMVGHVYSSLAYITPIISFLAVIFAQWSIQGKLITLPNFLENYEWAVEHLNGSQCYPLAQVHAGYTNLEVAMEKSEEIFETPRFVALVAHYAAQQKPEQPEDIEATTAADAQQAIAQEAAVANSWVYWQVRLLFNPRLQDERSQSFRNWALAYMLAVILGIFLSVYAYICCLVTCLEIERVLVPTMSAWKYTHFFSLRPDLDNTGAVKSLKQVAASTALSLISHGTRAFYTRAAGGLSHFQLGAAA